MTTALHIAARQVVAPQIECKAPSQEMEANALPAMISTAPLAGTWTNTDTATRDIVKVVIIQSGSGISVHAYGACSPTPCDWGTVTGIAYAASVSTSAGVAFSAQYNFGFSKVTLTGRLDGRLMTLESFTQFTDGSERNNYYSQMEMKK